MSHGVCMHVGWYGITSVFRPVVDDARDVICHCVVVGRRFAQLRWSTRDCALHSTQLHSNGVSLTWHLRGSLGRRQKGDRT